VLKTPGVFPCNRFFRLKVRFSKGPIDAGFMGMSFCVEKVLKTLRSYHSDWVVSVKLCGIA